MQVPPRNGQNADLVDYVIISPDPHRSGSSGQEQLPGAPTRGRSPTRVSQAGPDWRFAITVEKTYYYNLIFIIEQCKLDNDADS
jgi:hypothetical protein